MEFARNHGSNFCQSKRRSFQGLAADVKKKAIALCKCVVHQPIITAPDIEEWKKKISVQKRDSNSQLDQTLVSSCEHILYLSYCDLDESYRLAVIKEKSDEIFLTFLLKDLVSGNLKYKVKDNCWHEVTIISEGQRKREFVLTPVRGFEADNFNVKLKDILHELTEGRDVNRPSDLNGSDINHATLQRTPFSDTSMSSVNDAVPSGVGRPLGVQAVPYDHLKQIAQLLGAAIQGGNKEMAKQLAERLADEKVKVNVEVDAETHEQRAKELRFSVKVHIEDRESSGCSINLKVQTSDTIGDLKKKMMLEYEFPLEVQRWIIGKRIPKDEETLSKCGVKGPGHTVYLYLITAKSVNLTREDYIKEKELNLGGSGRLVLPEMASGDYMTMGAPYRQSLCQRVIPAQTPSRQQSTLSNVSSGSNISAVAENTPVRNSSQNDIPLLDPHSLRHKTTLPAQPPLGSAHQNIWNHEENVLVGGGGPEIPGQLQQTETPPRPAREVPQHTSIGWECPVCTFINKPFRPGCEICGEVRPPGYKIPVGYIMSDEEQRWLAEAERTEQLTREAEELNQRQQRELSARNFEHLLEVEGQDLVPNSLEFDCPICFDTVPVGEGVVLRECLHMFCRECLMDAVRLNEEAGLKCPYQDDAYSCPTMLQDREIRALVTGDIYAKYLQRSLDTAESQAENSYHCKTPDCHGWCIYEDLVNFFKCPVCRKENCLTCKAIHEGMNCMQYQEDLKIRAVNDVAAKQTQEMLERLVTEGEAMHCPKCKIIVQKKDGCDWIKCSLCKTEICWVTKGFRWGPLGEGDTTGGCGCRISGNKCHPNCNNCH